MQPRLLPSLLPSLLLLAAGGDPPAPSRGADSYEQVYEELRALAPDPGRAARVYGLVLRRDAAEFRLDTGTIHLLTPVGGRTIGAAFVGAGSISFRPPLEVERATMERVIGDSVLAAPITAAVFLFADSTLAELEGRLTFVPGVAAAGVAGRVDDALNFLVLGRERLVEPGLMTALLNGHENGFFAGYFKRARGEDLMFLVDPHEVEEILLIRRGRRVNQRIETVCQFPRAALLRDSVPAGDEGPDPLRLESYKIEATIAGNLDFSAAAVVRLAGRVDSVRWARFVLFDELEVDSVADEAHGAATFFRAKRGSDLWVRFDPPVAPGERRAVRIAYRGDLITRGSLMDRYMPPRGDPNRRYWPAAMDSWFFIRSTEQWFPRYGFRPAYAFRPAAAMDLTFHTPARYRFASIGRLVESRSEDDVRTTRWVTEMATQEASFNIGEFEEFEITDARIPPVVVHMNANAHRHLSELFLRQRDPQEQVGGDVANSLAFFTAKFGAPLFERYYATEIPYFHGQAFPGLIHLSWWTFQTPSESGWEEIFRAHEMAHQWWGIGVEPADYRDAWISEGFAMFAGLWYMQLILRDNEKYFKQLKEWRERLRAERNDAGPVGLGPRTWERDPEHYSLVVYRKGAWVLQMLRNLMLDLRTMDEERFTIMMQDFYRTYRGRRASTRDFQAVVERHTGIPMDWFFRQWVYGTDIPTYVVSWKTERVADGDFKLKLRVRQEDVPEHFIMSVPLLIEFPGGGQALVRVNVRGKVREAELRVPAEPARLQLNPLESVLAEVKEERWR